MSFRVTANGAHAKTHQPKYESLGGGAGWSLPPLTLQQTAMLHLGFVRQGFADSMKWSAALETVSSNKVIQANVIKSSILQAILLFSALAIRPLISGLFGKTANAGRFDGSGIALGLFNILWVYPLVLASFYFSGLFNLRVAERSQSLETDKRHLLNSRAGGGPAKGLTSRLVGESYRVLVILNWNVFGWLLFKIPFLGTPLCFAYYAVINSYYCFENHWLKQGWSVSERITAVETRWTYFLGFGAPATMVSWWSRDPVVNLALFSLFFPHFLIMASSSVPQPVDPTLPTSSLNITLLPQSQGSFSMAAAEGGEEARGRMGSPHFPIRMPVLILASNANLVLSKLLSPGRNKKDANGYAPSSQSHGYAAHGGWRGDAGASHTAASYGAYASPPRNVDPPSRRGHVASESTVGVDDLLMGGGQMRGNDGGYAAMSGLQQSPQQPILPPGPPNGFTPSSPTNGYTPSGPVGAGGASYVANRRKKAD